MKTYSKWLILTTLAISLLGLHACGDDDKAPFVFRADAPSDYTRVDRMGAPAVSTALIASKTDYNDDDPEEDVTGTAPGKWAGEIIVTLDALHAALDDDLTGLSLTPCASGAACATQEVGGAGGPPVHSFVIPDVLTVDTAAGAGFPNGRQLTDPVIDVILAVILLDQSVHTPTTLADVPVNPSANDAAFGATFPYLAAANAAP